MNINEINPEMFLKLPITTEMQERIEEEFTQYLFYKNERKTAVYYCTRCGGYGVYGSTFKHNTEIFCPECAETVIAYSGGYKRKQLTEKIAVGLYYSIDGILAVRIMTVRRGFPETPLLFCEERITPEIDFFDEYVYCFSKNKAVRYKNEYFFDYSDDQWKKQFRKMKSMRSLPIQYNDWSNTGFVLTLPINSEKIQKTELKYSGAEKFGNTVNDQIEYLMFYKSHNQIEYLHKAGFTNMVDHLIHCHDKEQINIINWKSNNMLRMLGIRKTDIGFVKGLKPKELVLYRDILNTDSGKDTEALYSFFKSNTTIDAQKLHERTGLTYSKMKRYIEKQYEKDPCGCRRNSLSFIATEWFDYIRMSVHHFGTIEEIMPKNVIEAHDRMNEKVKFLANIEENEKIKKRNNLLERLVFDYKNLCIHIPEDGNEIIQEGHILRHCVGGYVRRHAEGSTNILFIRHKDDPETPYFTIEVSNDYQIVQCHGYRNERYDSKPDEIKEFEKEYKNFLASLKKQESEIKLRIGA